MHGKLGINWYLDRFQSTFEGKGYVLYSSSSYYLHLIILFFLTVLDLFSPFLGQPGFYKNFLVCFLLEIFVTFLIHATPYQINTYISLYFPIHIFFCTHTTPQFLYEQFDFQKCYWFLCLEVTRLIALEAKVLQFFHQIGAASLLQCLLMCFCTSLLVRNVSKALLKSTRH